MNASDTRVKGMGETMAPRTTMIVANSVFWLNPGSALAAIAAAVFWARSATPLPPMLSYFGGAPTNDPFFVALQESARMNSHAAICAAISAFLFALATISGRLTVINWVRG